MKFLVGIILFLNVWLFAGQKISYSVESISQFKGYRNALLESLKNQKKDDVVSIAQYIKEQAPDEFAVDNLELIQIYLLIDRYDLALDLWIGEYEKVGRKVQYSFVRDSLLDYLDTNMNLTDSGVVNKKLEEIVLSNIDEEQRDLYKILLEMTPFYEMQNKFYAMHYKTWDREQQTLVYKLADKYVSDSLANSTFGQFVFENRVYSKFYYRSGMDPECMEKLILSLKEFERNFPNSERLAWIKHERNRFEELLKDYSEFLNYYRRKLYTGGLGIEGWITNSGYEIGIPIQFQRFLFVPTFDTDEKLNDEGWIFIFGFDLFEMKHLKIVPFVGLW
ncbi:MAG: hypothetical protein IJM92_12730, partial [Fibrobacter sp.]|uniref:hypothetical protein n=1 Tax=Fibrobacter sp. TaxID=35828 RepID=UPI0025C5737C